MPVAFTPIPFITTNGVGVLPFEAFVGKKKMKATDAETFRLSIIPFGESS